MRLQKQIDEKQVMKGFSQEQILNTINRSEEQKPKKKWTVGAIINTTIFYILLAILLVVAVFLLIGYRPAIVLTGSMRPTIQPGDVTVYKKVDIDALKVGDVIMFRGIDAGNSKQTTIDNVTHRIIFIDKTNPNDIIFYTHGDANGEVDISAVTGLDYIVANNIAKETVRYNEIQGRVEFTVPWIGIPLNFVRNNLMVCLFAAVSIIILSYIVSLMRKKKDDETNGAGI